MGHLLDSTSGPDPQLGVLRIYFLLFYNNLVNEVERTVAGSVAPESDFRAGPHKGRSRPIGRPQKLDISGKQGSGRKGSFLRRPSVDADPMLRQYVEIRAVFLHRGKGTIEIRSDLLVIRILLGYRNSQSAGQRGLG